MPDTGRGEGDTPLIASNRDADRFYKHEGLNPTGSYKDRCSAAIVDAARDRGVTHLHMVSSGNAALSIAAYGEPAGLDVTCHLPDKTSREKQDLIAALGASVERYPGSYEDVYHTVADMDLDGWNVTAGMTDISMRACRAIAHEILDAGVEPDVVVVPVGNGTDLAGTWHGFQERGASPRMVGVQMEDAAPLKVALETGKDHAVVEDPPASEAEGIIASESFECTEAVAAVRESDGAVETVAEEQIGPAMETLIHREGIIPEPTSAVIEPVMDRYDGTVVGTVTGSGLKHAAAIRDLVR